MQTNTNIQKPHNLDILHFVVFFKEKKVYFLVIIYFQCQNIIFALGVYKCHPFLSVISFHLSSPYSHCYHNLVVTLFQSSDIFFLSYTVLYSGLPSMFSSTGFVYQLLSYLLSLIHI